MKIVFFGTPEYVIPVLQALHKKYNTVKDRELIAVVTQNPKPFDAVKQGHHNAEDNAHGGEQHRIGEVDPLGDREQQAGNGQQAGQAQNDDKRMFHHSAPRDRYSSNSQ